MKIQLVLCEYDCAHKPAFIVAVEASKFTFAQDVIQYEYGDFKMAHIGEIEVKAVHLKERKV